MSMIVEYGNVAKVVSGKIEDWQEVSTESYRIQLLTTQDEDGVYSSVALNLPGAGSCGDTIEQSIANAKEAIKAVLEAYKESGDPIPWEEVTADKVVEGELKVIFVHV